MMELALNCNALAEHIFENARIYNKNLRLNGCELILPGKIFGLQTQQVSFIGGVDLDDVDNLAERLRSMFYRIQCELEHRYYKVGIKYKKNYRFEQETLYNLFYNILCNIGIRPLCPPIKIYTGYCKAENIPKTVFVEMLNLYSNCDFGMFQNLVTKMNNNITTAIAVVSNYYHISLKNMGFIGGVAQTALDLGLISVDKLAMMEDDNIILKAILNYLPYRSYRYQQEYSNYNIKNVCYRVPFRFQDEPMPLFMSLR